MLSISSPNPLTAGKPRQDSTHAEAGVVACCGHKLEDLGALPIPQLPLGSAAAAGQQTSCSRLLSFHQWNTPREASATALACMILMSLRPSPTSISAIHLACRFLTIG